jgi:AcrR family transcriptional regulator
MSDEAVLAATGEVIAKHGLTHLTLALVAEEAGLSPAAIVQRFGSKRGMLLAFARQAAPATRGPFERARASCDSPLAALRAGLAGFVAGVRSRTELANHMTLLELDIADPEFRPHAEEHARIMRQEIAALLGEAVTAGELEAGIDAERLARAVHVTFNGAQISWALLGEGTLADALRIDLDHLLSPYLKEDS